MGATVYVTTQNPSIIHMPYPILRGTSTDFDGKFVLKGSLNNFLIVRSVRFQEYHQKITSNKQVKNFKY